MADLLDATRRGLLRGVGAAVLAPSSGAVAQTAGLPDGFEPWSRGTIGFSVRDTERGPAIAVRSQASGGIIRRPLDLPLRPGLTLRWTWRVNVLPSSVAETGADTHDYTAVALAFEDGRDLSYIWSAALPRETHFACPLPGWPLESHLVVRSGARGLGQWRDETRDVWRDAQSVLGARPARVTGLWLVHYTRPQKGVASTDIARLALREASGTERMIFPA